MGDKLVESSEGTDGAGEPKPSDSERGEVIPHGPDSYLEIIRNVVDGAPNQSGARYYVQACGCKCWFCPDCCRSLGLKLRDRLVEVLESFQSLQMWTFTIDPLLFESPELAFEHVRKKRSLSELVRALKKRHHLISKRYFYVLEWQKITEMPHWHMLLETKHLPFEFACMVWNRNRPKELGPPEGERPGFGSVRFSAPIFSNHEHAANYATKYLIKHPDHGYPDWVLDMKGRVHRYGASRGFWRFVNETQKRRNHFDSVNQEITCSMHNSDCACGNCRGVTSDKKPRRNTSTIRERIKHCDTSCVVMKSELGLNSDGTFSPVEKYVGTVIDSYKNIRAKMNPERYIDKRRIRLKPDEVPRLLGESKRDFHESNLEWSPESASSVLPRIKEDTK